jgi:hypothetical protein
MPQTFTVCSVRRTPWCTAIQWLRPSIGPIGPTGMISNSSMAGCMVPVHRIGPLALSHLNGFQTQLASACAECCAPSSTMVAFPWRKLACLVASAPVYDLHRGASTPGWFRARIAFWGRRVCWSSGPSQFISRWYHFCVLGNRRSGRLYSWRQCRRKSGWTCPLSRREHCY